MYAAQCKGGACVGGNDYHTSCGRCASLGKEGDECGGPAFKVCGASLHCSYATSKPSCKRDGKLGEACAYSLGDALPCGPEAWCDGGSCASKRINGEACPIDAACATGLECSAAKTCSPISPLLTKGAACTPDGDQCNTNLGLHCAWTTKVCTEEKLAPASSSCETKADGVPGNCTASGFCGSGSVCVLTPKEGEACGYVSAIYPKCMPPAICDQKLCKLFAPSVCGGS